MEKKQVRREKKVENDTAQGTKTKKEEKGA